jgi:thymidine kinase
VPDLFDAPDIDASDQGAPDRHELDAQRSDRQASDESVDDPGGSPSIALSMVPAAGARRGVPAVGLLKFFHGPMDCGKSTLALQLDYNHSRQGRRGLLLTKLDRSGRARITSRMGISREAVDVDDRRDLAQLVRESWAAGHRVDYLIVDEAQFFTPAQIEQLAVLADDVQVDVYAFGIATDFRGRLFPGSARLFELADEVIPVQVEVLCWCGRPGRFNARVVDGVVARQGAQVLVADTAAGAPAEVRYQVLCRSHHRSGDLGPGADQAALPLDRPQHRDPMR